MNQSIISNSNDIYLYISLFLTNFAKKMPLFNTCQLRCEGYELLLFSIFIVPVNFRSTRTCGINSKCSWKCLVKSKTEFVWTSWRRQCSKDKRSNPWTRQYKKRHNYISFYTFHNLLSYYEKMFTYWFVKSHECL